MSFATTGRMFNTLKYAKMLEEVGFSREQAETSTKMLLEVMDEKLATKQDLVDLRTVTKQDAIDLRRDMADLRTEVKQDIAELRTELKQDIAELRTELKQDIAELRTELKQDIADVRHALTQVEYKLTLRMGTMLAASIAVLTAIQKLT
jgi:hypothetical protein